MSCRRTRVYGARLLVARIRRFARMLFSAKL